jgi:hypothetical protein
MSTIDSGLGWSVDESYYISDAGALIETAGGTTIKATAGGCIAVAYKSIYNNYGLALISTEAANVGMTVTGDCAAYPTVGNTPDSAEIGGKTWYLRATDSVAGRSSLDYLSDYQYMDTYIVGSGTIVQEIQAILTAANVVYDKRVVTDNYVKDYIEGVVKGNNERLKVGDVSTLKTTTKTDIVSAINELKGTIYTFHVDPDEADSYEAVTYHDDAVGMTPAYMDSTAFNYGSWENAFFMPKPCMLNYDGTVAYYLDPNDYSKKADGAASDISDLSFPGNAMMEFPLIWWKSWGDGWVSIADYQVDATYKCWSNRDADGNIIPYFYLPIYNGCI